MLANSPVKYRLIPKYESGTYQIIFKIGVYYINIEGDEIVVKVKYIQYDAHESIDIYNSIVEQSAGTFDQAQDAFLTNLNTRYYDEIRFKYTNSPYDTFKVNIDVADDISLKFDLIIPAPDGFDVNEDIADGPIAEFSLDNFQIGDLYLGKSFIKIQDAQDTNLSIIKMYNLKKYYVLNDVYISDLVNLGIIDKVELYNDTTKSIDVKVLTAL